MHKEVVDTYDLIIVGGGPTGINVGIECQKKNLKYLILEKGTLVNSIYNFPTNMTFFSTSKNLEIGGIPFISHSDKPTRKEALEYYRRILESFQLNIAFKRKVIDIIKSNGRFSIKTSEQIYTATNVVIATGFYDTPKLLNVPGENLQKVKHFYDDAHPYIGMNILVVGGANSACDVALETWQKGANVTMAIRNPTLYPKVKYWILPNIQNRIKEGAIQAYFDSTVNEITEKEVVLDTPNGMVTMANDYVLAMTGYTPNFDLLRKLGVNLSAEFKIPEHNPKTLETNIKGLFVAGVINAGDQTSTLFIENTRNHGHLIVSHI